MASGGGAGSGVAVGAPEVRDFFVSYTAADRSWAEWIGWLLEEAGYSVVIQAWDFRPASNFVSQMQAAAEQAERTLAVLSRAYLASQFAEAEWSAAFAEDPTGETGKLLPVRIEEFDPPGLLRPLVYVDLVGLGEVEARESVVGGGGAAPGEAAVPAGVPRSAAPGREGGDCSAPLPGAAA